jgi:hypothetical protein
MNSTHDKEPEMNTETPTATHDCGLCDAQLVFDGMSGKYETWLCSECEWWHIAIDCCSVDERQSA